MKTGYQFLIAVIVIAVVCSPIIILAGERQWHDIGTVVSSRAIPYYVDTSGTYKVQWIVVISTLEHGNVTLDSTAPCPLSNSIMCANSDASSLPVHQRVGVEKLHSIGLGDWYEIQVLPT